jgi:hypothetical protein
VSTDLPIPDFDHLPVGDLAGRIRTLELDQVNVLIDFELAHAARVPVLQVLGARRDQLTAGATPSGGDPAADPQRPAPPAAPPTVTPATAGPKINPPSQGDPTNPAQPRT